MDFHVNLHRHQLWKTTMYDWQDKQLFTYLPCGCIIKCGNSLVTSL